MHHPPDLGVQAPLGSLGGQPSICRSVNGRMPPARNTWRSNGVSIRTRIVNARPSAATVTSSGSGPSALSASTPRMVNDSCPVSPSDARRLAGRELERQHPHADEVRAVDALVALGQHRAHAEQQRALRRPVARRTRAVLLARDHDERNTFIARTAPTPRRSSCGAPSGWCSVKPPSVPGASWLRNRTLANVPRTITS